MDETICVYMGYHVRLSVNLPYENVLSIIRMNIPYEIYIILKCTRNERAYLHSTLIHPPFTNVRDAWEFGLHTCILWCGIDEDTQGSEIVFLMNFLLVSTYNCCVQLFIYFKHANCAICVQNMQDLYGNTLRVDNLIFILFICLPLSTKDVDYSVNYRVEQMEFLFKPIGNRSSFGWNFRYARTIFENNECNQFSTDGATWCQYNMSVCHVRIHCITVCSNKRHFDIYYL